MKVIERRDWLDKKAQGVQTVYLEVVENIAQVEQQVLGVDERKNLHSQQCRISSTAAPLTPMAPLTPADRGSAAAQVRCKKLLRRR